MKKLGGILAGLVLLISACSDPYADQTFTDTESMAAASYMRSEEGAPTMSTWADLLEYTGLFNTINLNADYTCFVPTNEAMKAYLDSKGVSSVNELDKQEAINLVKFHTIKGMIYQTTDFIDGALPDSTASGDDLTIEFREGGLNAIYVNGESRIANLNLKVTNGRIHTLEKVMTPVKGTIYDKLNEPDYSIILEAVKATGYDEKLSTIYTNVPNWDGSVSIVKYKYTFFAVTDATYKKAGISNVSDLARVLGESNTDYTDENNKLNQYVAYHMLNSKLDYKNLTPALGTSVNQSTMAKNQLINLSVDNDKYLNINRDVSTGYAVLMDQKNISTKNGIVHVVNDVMLVKAPVATKVQWELTDYPELAALCPNYRKQVTTASDATRKFEDGEIVSCYTTLWGNGAFEYYTALKNESSTLGKAKNNDYLVLKMGTYGWIQMESPTIVAGTYNIIVEHYNIAAPEKRAKKYLMIDGETIATFTTSGNEATKSSFLKKEIGKIEFKESSAHTVKLLAGDGYISYLDCITFDPVQE